MRLLNGSLILVCSRLIRLSRLAVPAILLVIPAKAGISLFVYALVILSEYFFYKDFTKNRALSGQKIRVNK